MKKQSWIMYGESDHAEVLAKKWRAKIIARFDNIDQAIAEVAKDPEYRMLCIGKLEPLKENMPLAKKLMVSGVDFIACDNHIANRLSLYVLMEYVNLPTAISHGGIRERLEAWRPRLSYREIAEKLNETPWTATKVRNLCEIFGIP